jgi:membrane protein
MDWRVSCELVRRSLAKWKEDNIQRRAAAVAYYTAVSLAPLLIIVIAVAGAVFGQQAARGEIADQVRGLVGDEGGRAIEAILEHARGPGSGMVATLIGFLVLLFGAGGVFVELQSSLNAIWKVPLKHKNWFKLVIQERFLSFAMVMGVCFLLLVSLVVSAGVAAFGKWLGTMLPGVVLLDLANVVISFLVITLLFAMMMRYLPDARIRWRDVKIGAVLTSVLFTLGKLLLGLYLGRATVSSSYGAAGSLVVLLIWVYYSAQIFFFGAEFTQVYAEHIRTKSAGVSQATDDAGH